MVERYRLGNEKSYRAFNLPGSGECQNIEQMKAAGLTLVIVADAEQVLGLFGIADEIGEGSHGKHLRCTSSTGHSLTVMLTGDYRKNTDKVASAVGVSLFLRSLLPEISSRD